MEENEYAELTKGSSAAKAHPGVNIDEDRVTAKQISATVAMFGQNIGDQGSDTDADDERQVEVDKYLATLDPKKRRWEEKKV